MGGRHQNSVSRGVTWACRYGWAWLIAAHFFALSVPGGGVRAADDSGRWSFTVGPAWQSGGRFGARMKTESVQELVGPYARGGGGTAPSIGPATGYANRTYEDGFVNMDEGTADPDTYVPGITWYWGYDHASQYDGSSLKFHSGMGERRSATLLPLESVYSETDGAAQGASFTAQFETRRNGRMAMGFRGGISWMQDMSLHLRTEQEAVRETVTDWRYVDTYRLPFSEVPPGPPYEGTYAGPGPLLYNEPTSRDAEVVSSRTHSWWVESELDARASQFLLRAGPYASFAVREGFGLRFSPFIMVNRVGVESTARTRIVDDEASSEPLLYSSSFSRTKWLYGGGVEFGARARIFEVWFADVNAMATWWSDDIELDVEPYHVSLSVGEYLFEGCLGREF